MKWILLCLLPVLLSACGHQATVQRPDPVQHWRSTVNTEVQTLLDAQADMSGHFSSYYHSDKTRERIERDMATIQQVHTRLSHLLVPDNRIEVHQRVLDATGDCSTAVDAYRSAFRTNNQPNTAQTGQKLFSQCLQKLEQLQKRELTA